LIIEQTHICDVIHQQGCSIPTLYRNVIMTQGLSFLTQERHRQCWLAASPLLKLFLLF